MYELRFYASSFGICVILMIRWDMFFLLIDECLFFSEFDYVDENNIYICLDESQVTR